MVGRTRIPVTAGFSLVEALVAMTVSTVVVFMAAGVFFAQNDFYGFLLQESRVHDNARSFLSVVEREVGSLVGSGLVVAESTRMVMRTPQTLGGICDVQGGTAYVHWASAATLDESTATGIAGQDSLSVWHFTPGNVSSAIRASGSAPAGQCAAAGADTTGAVGEFSEVGSLGSFVPEPPAAGDVIMVYEEVELTIATSTLDSALLALYRGPAGGTLVEYTTGVASEASFLYRVAGSWQSSVTSGSLDAVDAVRIVASAYEPAKSGTGSDADFSLTLDLPLKNR